MAEKIFNNSDSKQETCFAFKIETRESVVNTFRIYEYGYRGEFSLMLILY